MIAVLVALIAQPALALEVPKLDSYVTDYAGVLGQGDKETIENYLRGYDEKTGNQFVVLVVTSLEGESLEEYALAVAEKNRIGREGEDNGLLLLVAVQDRKLRFEVGYGLEPVLTDALTSVIIREVIAPEFRNGNYAQGIYSGMQSAVQATTGDFTPPTRSRSAKEDKKGAGDIVKLIVFIIIIFFAFRNRRGRGGGIWFIGGFPGGGGGFGGGGGGGFGGFSGGGGGFGGGGSSGSW